MSDAVRIVARDASPRWTVHCDQSAHNREVGRGMSEFASSKWFLHRLHQGGVFVVPV